MNDDFMKILEKKFQRVDKIYDRPHSAIAHNRYFHISQNDFPVQNAILFFQMQQIENVCDASKIILKQFSTGLS